MVEPLAALADIKAEIKPKLRGWLHLCTAPVAMIAGIVMIVLAPGEHRLAAIIYSITTVLLFTVSAVYHRGNWSPRAKAVLQRWDHANIFLIIAGSATPFAVALLPPGSARTLLFVLWAGAAAGALTRVLWVRAPRWLFVPLYLALGWASIAYLPDFLDSEALSPGVHVAAMTLVVTGGVLYTLGAGVFATKWPNPSPKWFGFHEIFHSFTLGGYITHYVAASLVLYGLR